MTSLFISYSRKDIEFAHKLTEAFKGQGLDFWIDWEGIPPTVDWLKEIEKGVEEADTFLAIDQGPIIVMIENHRTGLLWKLFMAVPEVQAGLRRLGFASPHLDAARR